MVRITTGMRVWRPVGPVHWASPRALRTRAAAQDKRERERTGALDAEALRNSSPHLFAAGLVAVMRLLASAPG
ncbi:hypothetical protein NDU88_006437 [Pleurodeles waltl]|uniref:Uncharacterized protein n=1 Tax=Pleurodeles waltl TaxID=8319 RepID=A0AAV7TFK9_PLEWA|nr:hypothetical protein NDU88_006437 [Pleurodeles waltl]